MLKEVPEQDRYREFGVGQYHFQELINPNAEQDDTEVILRICNHPLRPDAMGVLKSKWGNNIRILTTKDVAYGAHPDQDVLKVIGTLEGGGYHIVAVEPVGKPSHIQAICSGLALQPNRPMVMQAEFAQDDYGRKTVVGHDPKTRREIFRCTNYIELVPPDRGEGEGQ